MPNDYPMLMTAEPTQHLADAYDAAIAGPRPEDYLPSRTALNGALERRIDGWHWRADGALEPRVRDMILRDLAPNFRCATYGSGTIVEIPHDWTARKYWPSGHIDEDARAAIASLIAEVGAKDTPIYAEGLAERLDDHRLRKHGYGVPIELWDATMNDVVGCWWDKKDEADILRTAAAGERVQR